MAAKRKRKPVRQRLILGDVEVGGITSPSGKLELLLTMHGLDRQGNPVPVEFAVFEGNVDELLVTLQKGIATYKMLRAQGDA